MKNLICFLLVAAGTLFAESTTVFQTGFEVRPWANGEWTEERPASGKYAMKLSSSAKTLNALSEYVYYGAARKLELSFQYRGKGFLRVHFLERKGLTYHPVRIEKAAAVKNFSLAFSEHWTGFSSLFTIPPECAKVDGALRFQFFPAPGADLFLDDFLLKSPVPVVYSSLAALPHPRIENSFYDWFKRHRTLSALASEKKYDLILIGDTLIHNWELTGQGRGGNSWKKHMEKYKVLNLGFGLDRTQNMLWRVLNGELDGQNPKMVVLYVGSSNFSGTRNCAMTTPRETADAVLLLCRGIRKKCPDSRIAVIGTLPRAGLHDGLIREMNQILSKKVPEQKNCVYRDFSSLFRNPDGSLNKTLYIRDFQNLSLSGYELWSDELDKVVSEVLK